jgi:SSS family solute:Na+ symporter
MHLIDWILVSASLTVVLAFALYTRRFVKSVADFLAAGRCAGRYLLANARGEADSGLANTMAKFEQILVAGFVLNFWEKIQIPLLLIVAISGFVVYRFRETRALTLAQFLEQRYSRRYRTFMGGLAFVSGILNYGVFPAVSARFFIYFLQLPQSVHLVGFQISTFALIMLAYLSFTVFIVTIGGQVTMMVTDCVEGLLSHLIYVATVVAVFFVVSWRQIVDVMSAGSPGHSGMNPFDASGVEDFNFWFVVMYSLNMVYQTMALQNRQGFNAAARTPHESRMGFVLGNWRTYARMLMILVLGACAITFLKHPDFAGSAVSINAEINSIADPYLQKQMTVPVALSHLLPIGIKGLFCAMMIMGLFAGDSGHVHSWGSIFVQDVILPLRKRPLSPRQHIWLLRAAVVGVAAFAFVFSLLFKQTQYLQLWWVLSAMLFVGGAGVAIISGLYWSRGTTQAAWAGQITGSAVAMVGVLLTSGSIWDWISGLAGPWFERRYGVVLPGKFWFNGMQIAFIAACAAIFVYVIVSLLTCRQPFNLDRLLYRGAYALPGEGTKPPTRLRERLRPENLLQFDANFTFTDKLASVGIFAWAILLLAINLVVSAWNLAFHQWPITWWSHYWLVFGVGLPFVVAVGTLAWFGVGCTRDIFSFFAALRTLKRDHTDDGHVTRPAADEPVLADEAAEPIVPTVPSAKHEAISPDPLDVPAVAAIVRP